MAGKKRAWFELSERELVFKAAVYLNEALKKDGDEDLLPLLDQLCQMYDFNTRQVVIDRTRGKRK